MDHYILDSQGNPVKELDLIRWAQWYETADRRVAKDSIGNVEVSTVFLALDHNFWRGLPLLYETMIFGGENDQFVERYCNKIAALAGHDRAVALVRDSIQNPSLEEE